MKVSSLLKRCAYFLSVAGVLSAAPVSMVAAQNASYPEKPIRIIVPFSAGTGSDVFARTVGEKIGQETGQAVVVENRVGASGVIGTLAVARAPADGYTILMVANPFSIVAGTEKAPQYDPIKDFTPIAKVATVPIALSVNADLGVGTVKELVEHLKKHPGQLSYASSGAGTPSQIEMEIFKSVAGVDIIEVPYKSSSQALIDVMGGNIAMYPAAMPLALSQVDSGRIRVVGLFSDTRSDAMPDVPTMAEALDNPPGYVATPLWYGFIARAGTPPEIVERLRELVLQAMQSDEVRERLVGLGAQPVTPTNDEFVEQLKQEIKRSKEIAETLGIRK